MNLILRQGTEADYRAVEELTREAFWNLYVTGCDEHYFLHTIRSLPAFLPEFDFVATLDGRIVGHIAYMESEITDDKGFVTPTITFGPVSALPEFQKRGIGSKLISHTIELAKELAYKAIVIFGDPDYYKRFGFVAAKEYGITDEQGRFPYAMQILGLECGALVGVSGKFRLKVDYAPAPEEIEEFDRAFGPKEKFETESQKRFAEVSTKYL